MTDFVIIVALTVADLPGDRGCSAPALLHLLRGRSLRYQLLIATLLPVAAVAATVLVNVWLMFLSHHDSTVILVALVTAAPAGRWSAPGW